MNLFVLWFVKITGFIVEIFYYKRKNHYISNNAKNKIKGKALLISNHTSVMDYPLYMYLFFYRNLWFLTAEIIYKKGKFMRGLLNCIGSIKVDRMGYDFSFMNTCIEKLNKNKAVLIFPESRIPNEDERNDLLEFKPSYVYIALESNAPIIPLYTNGSYGKKERAHVMIGEPIYLTDLYDKEKSEEENVKYLNDYVRNQIKYLGEKLHEQE